MAKKSHKRTVSSEEDFTDKVKSFFGKLDSTWGRLLLITAFVIAGYKVGRVHEEVIRLRELNEMENKLNNALLDVREKYINEILDLKTENNLYKIKYEQK
ncbi:hypothetical protein [Bacteroides intestinalis]|uniref:Uncharacterized protein n=1 Tax=Bacteroides intestinalis TaxID=329854 RepID=A0AAQ0LMU2_9BACE|nr:hypothetical protein [Bacteroides intestinalis]RGT50916.1 hypothetical protein DWX27_13215 [Bacteroides intestinalis]